MGAHAYCFLLACWPSAHCVAPRVVGRLGGIAGSGQQGSGRPGPQLELGYANAQCEGQRRAGSVRVLRDPGHERHDVRHGGIGYGAGETVIAQASRQVHPPDDRGQRIAELLERRLGSHGALCRAQPGQLVQLEHYHGQAPATQRGRAFLVEEGREALGTRQPTRRPRRLLAGRLTGRGRRPAGGGDVVIPSGHRRQHDQAAAVASRVVRDCVANLSTAARVRCGVSISPECSRSSAGSTVRPDSPAMISSAASWESASR